MNPDPAPETGPILLPNTPPQIVFLLKVDSFYASLISHASSPEAGLGGRLIYVGELNESGRALMVASNIAGAESLAATSDPAAQKQAIRDGVADFLVTSLDEALRILKNEVRKREPVAVCVAASPAAIEQEMLERGVLPDLVRDPGEAVARAELSFSGSPAFVVPIQASSDEAILTWSVDEAPARWLPRLDAIAMACLASDESASTQIALRWLRFAPRYLGRLAGNLRVLLCSTAAANAIAETMRAAIQSGEIPVPVRIDFVES